MKVVIVGPGAMGCLFAALLTEAEFDVTLLDKDEARARLIFKQGVLLEKDGRTRAAHVPTTAVPEDIAGPVDFVCLCVKAFDTRSAIQHAAPLVGQKTTVVSIQNGLGNAEEMARVVGAGKVVCAVTSQASTSLGLAHIRHAGVGMTSMAPFSTRKSETSAFARLLRNAGAPTEVLTDAPGMIWGKLVVNAAVNCVTAVWGVPNGEILTKPHLKETADAIALEVAAVAEATGINLPYADPVAEMTAVCQATASNISSMLQDVRNGKPTEVEAINGAIVKQARAVGVPVPINRALLAKARKLKPRKRLIK